MVRQSNIGSSVESKELVVYSILRDSACNVCGKELWKGDFLFMDGEHPPISIIWFTSPGAMPP
jgi:hypothetical protein